MSDIFKTLGGKSLSELPQIPTELTATGGATTATLEWVNNNTNVENTINVTQYYEDGIWVDSTEVVASATTAVVTGMSNVATYNFRVAVKTTENKYYSSRIKDAEISPYPSSGLQARWEFEDNNDDSSENNNDLTDNYSSVYVTGKVGKGFTVSGTRAELKSTPMQAVFNNTNPFTVSCWVKNGLDYNGMDIPNFKGSIGWILSVVGNYVRYGKRAGGQDTVKYISLNNWHHVVMTFSGTETKIYIDNILEYTLAESNSVTLDSTQKMVYCTSTSTNFVLDQYYVYNRALSVSEIAQLWNSGAGI